MKNIKLYLIIIICMLLAGCAPIINKNIEFESGVMNEHYPYVNVYYNDVKYVEPLFSSDYNRYLTENDIVLYKQLTWFGITYVYTNEIDNPDYLFIPDSNRIGIRSLYSIYFREDINLKDEWFIYENIEIKFYNELTLVDKEFNDFFNSLVFNEDEEAEIEFVNLYDGKDIVDFTMKKYPEISCLAASFVLFNGEYYARDKGNYYKVSEEFIELCNNNGYIFK